MAEYDRRDVGVFEMPVGLSSEEPVAQTPACSDCDRSQLRTADDIADSVDTFPAGDLIGVSLDEAIGIELDTRALQTKPFDRRHSSDGPDDAVEGCQLAAVPHLEVENSGRGPFQGVRPGI